jgi:two-component system, OmpR family, phosphate regulon sensor histidine kinase PhoR
MTTSTAILVALAVLAAVLFGWWLGQRSVVAPAPTPPPAPPPAPSPPRISIESLADPALLIQGDITIAANDEARRLFGERVAGSDPRLTIRHPVVLDAVAEARASGLSVEREVAGLATTNSAYRIRAVDAGEGRTLVTFDDITQARLTERMRVDFVANASHELRTPLATLTGFIETLQGPAAEDEPARRRFLDIMAREAARMSRLIDDLLSLSRIELDKHVRPVTVMELDGIISDVAKTLAMRLEADERQVIIDEHGPLPPVIADRDQVLQVLHNLVSNALKYGQSGTPITVIAAAEPAHGGQPALVRMTVSDVSEGIAPEHIPRLTERFYRVDSLRSRKMGGTGLGLAIVKHIVERHRGRLEIESRAGEGTRVCFTLPQAVATIDAATLARAEAAEPGTGVGLDWVTKT